ncbi:MAG: HlyD family efflux transporter periplasmic adaptor subunit [Bacteroidota bacterium]|nr:HlyD family efflux transporter periplasmic adaptor subunit [Bacteroidota bacterium]
MDNSKRFVKKRMTVFLLMTVILGSFFSGCHHSKDSIGSTVIPKVPVTVVSPRVGVINEYSELTATSSFLVKAQIKSPISGYVEKCSFSPGDKVKKGELMFQLRTREAAVLKHDTSGSMGINGLVRIVASLDGIVLAIDHPRGDYVQEGDPLCTIVVPESLVFLLDLPYEVNSMVKKGSSLTLTLPDNKQIAVCVKSTLPAMNEASQTQRVILQPISKTVFPENMVAKVRILRNSHPNAIILPKSCILSDEIMKNFWIMKLVNDTMAIKMQVKTGTMNNDSIEIVFPALNSVDRILESGNYGLGDTIEVKVMNK